MVRRLFAAVIVYTLFSLPLAASPPCDVLCNSGWRCFGAALQKRMGGKDAYLKRCIPGCQQLLKQPELFKQSQQIMQRRCREKSERDARSRVCSDDCARRQRCRKQRPTPQARLICQRSCSDRIQSKSGRELWQRETRALCAALPLTGSLDCDRLCRRALRCQTTIHKRRVVAGAFLERCLLGCVSAKSQPARTQLQKQVAQLCRTQPLMILRQPDCATSCRRGWHCLAPNVKLVFDDDPKRYAKQCLPRCRALSGDATRMAGWRRVLERGCNVPKKPVVVSRPTLVNCSALCARGWRCLDSRRRRRVGSRSAYVKSCLASCGEARKDPRRFTAGVRSIEAMCRRAKTRIDTP